VPWPVSAANARGLPAIGSRPAQEIDRAPILIGTVRRSADDLDEIAVRLERKSLRRKRSADRARNAVGMAESPGANPMSTANPDAELVARGERFEKFLLEYMDAWLEWAPLMRAARAQVGDDIAVLITAIERTGCDAAQARMSELERDMQPLAEEIIAAPATSLSGLRAKALVALWEALPSHAFHHGAFEFRDDGEASRSLFDAVAGMTGLTPLVRELEARLAADVELKGAYA
jgi:hypothetical protein